jgi:signal transduction histidine kinase
LSHYRDSDFLLQQKAKVLSANTLAAICIILFLFAFYLYYNSPIAVVLPPAVTLAICFVILGLLKGGYFTLAGHLLVITILSATWITLFIDNQDLVMKLDTISFVLGAFALLSLTVNKSKKTIFIYLAINIVILFYFISDTVQNYDLAPAVALEYSIDNIVSLIFISVVCYQVVTINQNALEKANDSIQLAQSEIKKNQELNLSLEMKVAQRTKDLHYKNEELQCEIKERKTAESKLRETQEQLIAAAHKAGMAEIATDSLHNVGNILNSVKTSAYVIKDALNNCPLSSFSLTCDLIRSHQNNLKDFVQNDPKALKIFDYCLKLEFEFTQVFEDIEQNIDRLNVKVDNITEVIVAQQTHAGNASFLESLHLVKIIEDSLIFLSDLQINQDITIVRNYETIPLLFLQKSKMLHILINLFKNAVEAMRHPSVREKTLTIDVYPDTESVILRITDTGLGITRENARKIFSHGFTTKTEGYGFGLHTCANYANEMGASISAESQGSDKGASFQIRFPVRLTK